MMARPLCMDWCGVVRSTCCPSKTTVPLSFSYTPERIFIRVDLPAPFSPTRPCTVPRLTSSDTPSSAFTPGNDLETSLIDRMTSEPIASMVHPPRNVSGEGPSRRSETSPHLRLLPLGRLERLD